MTLNDGDKTMTEAATAIETIGWNRENDGGYLVHSKVHYLDPNDGSRTLCGQSIPADADVSGCGGVGHCMRCKRAAGKIRYA